jgi:hypothetical protein
MEGQKLLRATEMIYYYLLDPLFYRPGGCVIGMTAQQLLERLRAFPAYSTSEEYRAQLPKCLSRYKAIFYEKVGNEADIRLAIVTLIEKLITLVDSGDQLRQTEIASAAAGLIAKRKCDRPNEIDDSAGYAGRVDMMFNCGYHTLRKLVLLVIEAKYIRVALDTHRYFVVAGALLAQILQSQFGHEAPFSLAITQQGFKVYCFEYLAHEEATVEERAIINSCDPEGQIIQIHCFPPAGVLFRPNFTTVDEGLEIFGELARIISAVNQPGTPSQATRDPHAVVSPLERPLHPNGQHASIRGQNRQTQADRSFFVRDGEGGLKHIQSINLHSRYTESEIEELLDPRPSTKTD